jgi:hypothetical protein
LPSKCSLGRTHHAARVCDRSIIATISRASVHLSSLHGARATASPAGAQHAPALPSLCSEQARGTPGSSLATCPRQSAPGPAGVVSEGRTR